MLTALNEVAFISQVTATLAGTRPGGAMPYASQAQRKYFNANRAKLEREGVSVDEWNRASKGKSLPARARTATAKLTSPRRK